MIHNQLTNITHVILFSAVPRHRHRDVGRMQPQAGGERPQGPGGVHQDRTDSRRVTEDVRPPLRRNRHSHQQSEYTATAPAGSVSLHHRHIARVAHSIS